MLHFRALSQAVSLAYPTLKWLGTSHLHPDHFFTALLSRYIHLSLEQHGFQLRGFPYRGLFSIVNTAVLPDLQLVESMDAEGPCIQGANCNLHVVQGSTVPNLLVYNVFFIHYLILSTQTEWHLQRCKIKLVLNARTNTFQSFCSKN